MGIVWSAQLWKRMERRRRTLAKRIGETVVVAILFGFLFEQIHIPLPWMLGPVTGVMLWNLGMKRKVAFLAGFRNAGLMVLGYMIGCSFTADTGKQILGQLPAMLIATVLILAFSLAIGWIMAKRTGINVQTGIIGSVPGGLSQMVVLSEEVKDADTTTVALMQTIRLLSVLFIVPFLAFHGFSQEGGAIGKELAEAGEGTGVRLWESFALAGAVIASPWAASRLKFPTPYFLGPVVATAMLMIAGLHPFPLAPVWINLAQVCLGTHLGTTMKLNSLKNWKTIIPFSVLGSIGTVLISMAVSWVLARLDAMSLLTAFLGTAPGGMSEMGVTAALTGGDVLLVTAFQMFRILFILLLVPPFLRWMFIKRSVRPQGGNPGVPG